MAEVSLKSPTVVTKLRNEVTTKGTDAEDNQQVAATRITVMSKQYRAEAQWQFSGRLHSPSVGGRENHLLRVVFCLVHTAVKAKFNTASNVCRHVEREHNLWQRFNLSLSRFDHR